jgi:hypothetical protein
LCALIDSLDFGDYYMQNVRRNVSNYLVFFQKISNQFITDEISNNLNIFIESLDMLNRFLVHNFFDNEEIIRENSRFRLHPVLKHTQNDKYLELRRQLDVLCSEVEKTYKQCRLAIKRCLFL